MSMNVNCHTYDNIINEDIVWLLSNTDDSLERQHIIAVLKSSAKEYRKLFSQKGDK